ncbi:uncharacterized protein LOC134048415 isoform X2 [Cinclus cinclus]|uniref:uncharacterized protein LOC134048415 isoform X2 n=1 Tax=Cinclus cinclus TaxID=127875 RepID=UPI002E12AA61
MVTMRLLGSLELWLANTFLPLLLLTWLSVGTVSLQAEPVTTVQFKICLENLTVQVKWYKPECLEEEIQINTVVLGENCMNFSSSSLCIACTEICVCRVSITRPNSTGTGSSTQTAILREKCMNFSSSGPCIACTEICVCRVSITGPNSTYPGNGTQTTVLRKNRMNFSSSGPCIACTEICVCRVSITGPNSTYPGNGTQTTVLRKNRMNFSSSGPCIACTEISVCRISITGPNLTDAGNSTQATVLNFLCILLGLAVGTLLHMPVIGFLLWQRRRNRTGELLSEEVAEKNQTSMAALVTEAEDLTYANLNFEMKVTEPTSSNIIYTKIKPLQQKQSGGDDSAASKDVNVYSKEEGE